MAAMYSNEYKDVLPGTAFFPNGAGGNPWDVGKGFTPAVAATGLTVPMWFCPVRTDETAAQYAAARTLLGHDLITIDDLNTFLASYFNGGFVILNHNLWVSRVSTMAGVMSFSLPDPSMTMPNTDPAIYGWPTKITDQASSHVPFISDACFSGYGSSGPKTDNINISGASNLSPPNKTSGHVSSKSIGTLSVNATYADGHVEFHKKPYIRCVYSGANGSYWFY
jgi:prepilin-type processing-associated H-X9-DG protein